MTDIRIKRGQALIFTDVCANADGSAFDLTQVTLAGMVRDSRDNLLGVLTFTMGVPGTYQAVCLNTILWPEGMHKVDIAFASLASGNVVYSETMPVYVERAVSITMPDAPAPDPVTDGLGP
ncbi:hypothetical protein [Acidocella sp.]|uniref:hypothetical protein n=1 Tax=Acidocella sp. TaxID=50710 RepID=UPI002604B23F|nr:hypothetical protein [Acidocella sp.]